MQWLGFTQKREMMRSQGIGTTPPHDSLQVARMMAALEREVKSGRPFAPGEMGMRLAEIEELERAEAFGAEILKLCVEVGGVLTGEHGVGVEKRDLMGEMFSEADLNQQQRVKCAFDPRQVLNPGKVFPTLHRCAELGRVHVHDGRTRFPELPRF